MMISNYITLRSTRLRRVRFSHGSVTLRSNFQRSKPYRKGAVGFVRARVSRKLKLPQADMP